MRRVVILIFGMTTIATAQQAAPEIESIRRADLKADLAFLASDRMAGRLTDAVQDAIAAEWIAARLKRLGLNAVGDGGTFYHRSRAESLRGKIYADLRPWCAAADRHRVV